MSYTDFDFPHTHYYDTDLRELICKVTAILKGVADLEGWKEEHEKEYEELKKFYDDLMAGNFTPEMEQALYQWTVENTVEIIGKAIKTVFFGLTDDGYFVAYIPDSWNNITFGTTGYDDFPEGVEYGRLTLTY